MKQLQQYMEGLLNPSNKIKVRRLFIDSITPFIQAIKDRKSRDTHSLIEEVEALPVISNRKLINKWKRKEKFGAAKISGFYGKPLSNVTFYITDPMNDIYYSFDIRSDATNIWSYRHPEWQGSSRNTYHEIPLKSILELLEFLKSEDVHMKYMNDMIDCIKKG